MNRRELLGCVGLGAAAIGIGAAGEISLREAPPPPSEGSICFRLNGDCDVLRLDSNGDIYVKGRLVENDKAVVDAFREWTEAASKQRQS